MKKLLLLFLLACGGSIQAQNWLTDFEAAKAAAAKENKNILLVFSGSDWCAPCIRLDKSIWQSAEFKAEAAEKWILVRADFPKKKEHQLADAQKKANDLLAEKYNREGNFPLVVLLDKTGKVLGKTGFKNVTPTEYIVQLHSLEKK